MRIWIDATDGRGQISLFGMTLVERLVRGLVDAGVETEEIRVELSPGRDLASLIPVKLADDLPLRVSVGDEPAAARLAGALRDARGGPVLALSGDTVVDTRLLAHLASHVGNVVYRDGEGDARGAAARFEGEPFDPSSADGDLLAVATRAVERGTAKDLLGSECEEYIPKLRRRLPYYIRRVDTPARRDATERFLFQSNYKGSTDFLTKHVYPPIVWALVKPLSQRRVHPNWVTGIDIVATFAAIPFFAAGMWVPGLLLAYLMSVLDSVDGKLARVTFTSTRIGDVLDHGLDIVHPPFWYMAWGWALGGGSAASGPFRASLWLLLFYVIDRLLAALFKHRIGISIHAFTPFDERMRTFISRRNVNLAFFTVALLVGGVAPAWRLPVLAFYAMVAWQAACCGFHADRVIRFWNARPGAATN